MGLADSLHPALGRRDDVLEGLAGQVDQLHPLEVGSEDAARLVR
jgi:hypothetical protein